MTMLVGVSIALALLVAIFYYPARSMIEDLGIFKTIVPLGVESCTTLSEAGSCEDIVVHYPSGMAFMGCGKPKTRRLWFPPCGLKTWNKTDQQPIRDKIYSYEFKTGKLVELTPKGLDGDFVTHGIGIHQLDEETLVLAFVNHQRTGSGISLFEHTLGSTIVRHLETVVDPLITTPNDVLPISKTSFYVTNDHRYESESGLMRAVEEYGRRPWSNVVLRGGRRYNEDKKVRVIADGIGYANGITHDGNNMVYVSSVSSGQVLMYQRKKDDSLKLMDTVKMDFLPDNLAVDPTNGAIYVAGHPQPLKLGPHYHDATALSPSAIAVIRNNTDENKFYGKKYMTQTVFQDTGKLISGSTIAVPFPEGRKMLVGGIFSDGILVCDLPAFK